jgi:hypothetical protein
MYPRLVEILQLIGSSGLVNIPSERSVEAPEIAEDIERFYQGAMQHGSGAMCFGIDPAGQDWTTIVSWPDLVPVELPRPALTLQDLQRITRAELKRGRRADKLRQLSARGAIARG